MTRRGKIGSRSVPNLLMMKQGVSSRTMRVDNFVVLLIVARVGYGIAMRSGRTFAVLAVVMIAIFLSKKGQGGNGYVFVSVRQVVAAVVDAMLWTRDGSPRPLVRSRNVFDTSRFLVGVVQGHPYGNHIILVGFKLLGNVIGIDVKAHRRAWTMVLGRRRFPQDVVLSHADAAPGLYPGDQAGQGGVQDDRGHEPIGLVGVAYFARHVRQTETGPPMPFVGIDARFEIAGKERRVASAQGLDRGRAQDGARREAKAAGAKFVADVSDVLGRPIVERGERIVTRTMETR